MSAAGAADTVGSLLATIANLISEGLTLLSRTDMRHWGPDEHEQVRALELALDEAKRDFQELAPLVNGQTYYENDRIPQSLAELCELRERFSLLLDDFYEWSHAGGPINPGWAKDTADLRRDLHRAQCRAAQRIFRVDQQEGAAPSRCLGAFIVFRKQRAAMHHASWASRSGSSNIGSPPPASSSGRNRDTHPPVHPPVHPRANHRTSEPPPARTRRSRSGSIPRYNFRLASSSHHASLDEERPLAVGATAAATAKRQARLQARVEELMACNGVGRFQRHGDHDLAFVCDFCDGHIVWEDLERMPTTRTVDDLDTDDDSYSSPLATTGSRLSLLSSLSSPSGRSASPPATAASSPLPRWQPHKRSSTASTILSNASTASRASTPAWRATGVTRSSHSEKGIVFAPVAIASHVAPSPREWLARILCPVCEANGGSGAAAPAAIGGALGAIEDASSTGSGGEDNSQDDGMGDPEEERWLADEGGFDDLAALQEHLEWEHAEGMSANNAGSCMVM